MQIMKFRYNYIYFLISMFALFFTGCKKDDLNSEEKSITGVKVYDDTSIRIPLDIVAGQGFLLSAYYAREAPFYRFMLTDNRGNHLWTKYFGVTGITGILAENNGTFTIFDNARLINIDTDGNIVADIPDFLSEIGGYLTSHVTLNKDGNYFFYGTISNFGPNYAFAFEITHDGTKIFKKIYTAGSIFTGCQQTSDGGYLFFGNFYNISPLYTRFFLCKMSSSGTVEWMKNHTSPDNALNQGPNYYYTHDILETNDGNYICFVGNTDLDIDHASRIYKVSPDGMLLDSTDITFSEKNILAGRNKFGYGITSYPYVNGYCSVKKPDGTYQVFLNNSTFEEEIATAELLIGNRSFAVNFNDDLSFKKEENLQNQYTDYFTAVCLNSEGRIAALGFISSFGNRNKPVIIIFE